jgi:S-ribosylhomocysteine lyase
MPGLYLSRRDGEVTTFDLRFKKPNTGDLLTNAEMHSVEHIIATLLRNGRAKDAVIYFGPMGCQTGFYLLTRNVPDETVLAVTKDVLRGILAYEGEVFGASAVECGNYANLDLAAAKKECAAYLEVLENKVNDFKYAE